MCHFLANQLIGDEISCIFDVYGQESIFWKIDIQDSSKKLEFMNILDIVDDLLVDRGGHEVGGNTLGQYITKKVVDGKVVDFFKIYHVPDHEMLVRSTTIGLCSTFSRRWKVMRFGHF
jgi:hypothetical protein